MTRNQSMSLPDVALSASAEVSYPAPPFNPPKKYAEFEGSGLLTGVDAENRVYPLVRESLFRALGGFLPADDGAEIGSLRAFCGRRPSKIVVKPNWVRQQVGSVDAVTTHGSVLRPLIDYLFLAFPQAEIIVADIPLQSADLNAIWNETGIVALREHYAALGRAVRFADFRRERLKIDHRGFILGTEKLSGDPHGYVEVSLGSNSYLDAISTPNVIFSVSDYEPGLASCHHRRGAHAYLVPKSVLEADLFVNVAKLKTHCKTGLTGCMKNLVGINGDKGWIPHYREGSPRTGGDEFPNTARQLQVLRNWVRRNLQKTNPQVFGVARWVWRTFKNRYESQGRLLSAGGA